MRNPFRSKYDITQYFGNNPAYYGQFGLKGHEGIDLVPTGTSLDLLALEDGRVVTDDDIAGEPKADAYGKYVTIWHPTIMKATMYCHMKENVVSLGDAVTKGQVIGTMGNTGNTTGPHLHLNLFEVDANGVRQHRDNGYLGGIDPLPFLEDTEEQGETPLEACLLQHTQLVTKLEGIDMFQKSISTALFPNEPLKSWQNILDQINVILRDNDSFRGVAKIGDKLWDELVRLTGVQTVKYEDESVQRLFDTLQVLRDTPLPGKIMVDEKDYNDTVAKANKRLEDWEAADLIIAGIKKLFWR